MNSVRKLNEKGFWLLSYVRSLHPRGYVVTNRLPAVGAPLGISMSTMRGLQKRGFVREDQYIFFITDKGLQYLEKLK